MKHVWLISSLMLLPATAARADLYLDSAARASASVAARPQAASSAIKAETAHTIYGGHPELPLLTNTWPDLQPGGFASPLIWGRNDELLISIETPPCPTVEIHEFPPPPSSTSLLLSAFFGLGAWQVARTTRLAGRADHPHWTNQIVSVDGPYSPSGYPGNTNIPETDDFTCAFQPTADELFHIKRCAEIRIQAARAPPVHSFHA